MRLAIGDVWRKIIEGLLPQYYISVFKIVIAIAMMPLYRQFTTHIADGLTLYLHAGITKSEMDNAASC